MLIANLKRSALGLPNLDPMVLITKTLISAAVVVGFGVVGAAPASAHPIAACAGITSPAANQACIDGFLRDDAMHRYQMGEGECQSSPMYGQVGQFCRN
jgi:hypothetical protein